MRIHQPLIVHEMFGGLMRIKLCLSPTPPDFRLCFCLSVGVNMFYICIIIYLYGDLAIYAAAVPISLMEVAW